MPVCVIQVGTELVANSTRELLVKPICGLMRFAIGGSALGTAHITYTAQPYNAQTLYANTVLPEESTPFDFITRSLFYSI